MKIKETEEYKEAFDKVADIFDKADTYAMEVEQFVAKHGDVHLPEEHKKRYMAARTYRNWRKNKKLRRKVEKTSKKLASIAIKRGILAGEKENTEEIEEGSKDKNSTGTNSPLKRSKNSKSTNNPLQYNKDSATLNKSVVHGE